MVGTSQRRWRRGRRGRETNHSATTDKAGVIRERGAVFANDRRAVSAGAPSDPEATAAGLNGRIVERRGRVVGAEGVRCVSEWETVQYTVIAAMPD